MKEILEVEILGTGTSTGVPQIGCDCEVCRSTDPRDARLRTSAIVFYRGKRILIDCGPDFRTQILNARDWHLDALLITHIHYDHVGGIDDLRPYGISDEGFPVFARQDVINDLQARLPYCFAKNPYPGVPRLSFTTIDDVTPFEVCGINVTPIPVMHYKLPILGFHIGPLAYITDCKYIAPEQIERLHGVPLLIINALRQDTHLSHMSLAESLAVIEQIDPEQAYIIHMSHGIGLHAEVEKSLPTNVHLAYDGMIVSTRQS